MGCARHYLKILPEYFDAVLSGKKTFEVRYNDRDFKEGDLLILEEYSVFDFLYTGRTVCVKVTYILDNPDFVKKGYVILGIKKVEEMKK